MKCAKCDVELKLDEVLKEERNPDSKPEPVGEFLHCPKCGEEYFNDHRGLSSCAPKPKSIREVLHELCKDVTNEMGATDNNLAITESAIRSIIAGELDGEKAGLFKPYGMAINDTITKCQARIREGK